MDTVTLRSKSILSLLGLLFVLGLAEYGLQRWVLLDSLRDIDRAEVREDLTRVAAAFDQEIRHLERTCRDWASWSDTYQFVRSGLGAYGDTDVALETFLQNRIDLVYILNERGEVVWRRLHDLESRTRMQPSAFPDPPFSPSHPLLSRGGRASQGVSGVFNVAGGPTLLMAVQPIHSGGRFGPPEGALILGRIVDKGLTDRLIRQTRVAFTIAPPGDARADRDGNLARPAPPAGPRIRRTDEGLEARIAYPNITGDPAFEIRTSAPFTADGRVRRMLLLSAALEAVTGLLILLGMILFFRRDARRPAGRIPEHENRDGRGRDIPARLESSRTDEIGSLLRQSQKMEAIGTLASGIAHDFNNILMTIMMNTEFALKKLGEGPPLVRESLNLSHDAAVRAKDLVEQILTFSRKGDQKRHLLDLSPIIKESIKMVRASLPAMIRIESRIAADTGLVMANPTQIQQILINLCTNAAHAMKENGGILTIEMGPVDVAPDDPSPPPEPGAGEYLSLRVTDTGHGMSQEVVDRSFDPFFTTKPVGEGTGMGLAVVHGIVEGLGGGIRVESAVGKGTTFEILLPRRRGRRLPETAPPRRLRHGRGRILVVDDEQPVVNILEKILREGGYDVVPFTDSKEVLAAFHRDPEAVDLVVTDQTMPGPTGTELAQHLLDIRPDIPIIMCTGFSELISREQALAMGIREFIPKPVSGDELLHIIYDILHEK